MPDRLKNRGDFLIFGTQCSASNYNLWGTGDEVSDGEGTYWVNSIYIWMMLSNKTQHGFNVDVYWDGRVKVAWDYGFVVNVFIVQHFARHLSTMIEEEYPRDRLFLAEDGVY